MSAGAETTQTVSEELPDGPLGERARWILSVFRQIRAHGIDTLDLATIHPAFVPRGEDDQPDEDFLRGLWGKAAQRMGNGFVAGVEQPDDTSLSVLLEVEDGRRFLLTLDVEPAPPHRLLGWRTAPAVPAGESVQRRAVVADWGVRPGCEHDLERLLRGLGAGAARRGLTHLAIYSSSRTPGWSVLDALAPVRDTFHMWTPPLELAPDAAERGTYVDALAF